jgi:hypothetical protein
VLWHLTTSFEETGGAGAPTEKKIKDQTLQTPVCKRKTVKRPDSLLELLLRSDPLIRSAQKIREQKKRGRKSKELQV